MIQTRIITRRNAADTSQACHYVQMRRTDGGNVWIDMSRAVSFADAKSSQFCISVTMALTSKVERVRDIEVVQYLWDLDPALSELENRHAQVSADMASAA